MNTILDRLKEELRTALVARSDTMPEDRDYIQGYISGLRTAIIIHTEENESC